MVAKGDVTIAADVGGEPSLLNVQEILCVPDLAMNLLSVHKICGHDHRVVFSMDGCEVHNSVGDLIAVGKQDGGLYKLCRQEASIACAAKPLEDLTLWHRRMGHLNPVGLKKLRELTNGVQFDDAELLPCETCSQGKHQRKSFKHKGTRANEVLNLVHSDLCGPMETPSIGKCKYFLTFIDDCSRMTFLYFLQSKTEVIECFVHWRTAGSIKCACLWIQGDGGHTEGEAPEMGCEN